MNPVVIRKMLCFPVLIETEVFSYRIIVKIMEREGVERERFFFFMTDPVVYQSIYPSRILGAISLLRVFICARLRGQ